MSQARFLRLAEDEVEEAMAYFDRQLAGLGDRFQREVEHTVALIVQHPDIGSPLTKAVRKFRVRKFKYNVVYVIDDDIVVVVAVAHCKKRPRYWRKRLVHIP